MKNTFAFIGILVFGAVLTTVIDHLIGIEFKSDVGPAARIAHQATYMLWGATLVFLNKKLG